MKQVLILFHSTSIQTNYQPVVHIGTIRQAARIVLMEGQGVLRTGNRAICHFCFMYRPEYLKPGARLIFREGRTKGVGKIGGWLIPQANPSRDERSCCILWVISAAVGDADGGLLVQSINLYICHSRPCVGWVGAPAARSERCVGIVQRAGLRRYD
jgi:hypothetical protein